MADESGPRTRSTDPDRDDLQERIARGPAKLRDFSQSLPMALLRAREAVMQHFRVHLRAFDLTEQQWRVLRALQGADEIDITALVDATFLLAPSLTRILRDLEDRRLISRRADPADLRAALLSLSPRGRAVLDEAGVDSEVIYSRLTARLGEDRLDALMRILRDVERELKEPLLDPGDLPQHSPGSPRRRKSAR